MEELKQLQENELGYVLVKENFIQEFLQDKDLTLIEAQELFKSVWQKITEDKPVIPNDIKTANDFYSERIGRNWRTHEFFSKLLVSEYDYKEKSLVRRANNI